MKFNKRIVVSALVSSSALFMLAVFGVKPVQADSQTSSPIMANWATVDKAKINLYDRNGNKLDRDVKAGTNLVAHDEMTKADETYYHVGPGSWIKGCDVYQYNNETHYVSTYTKTVGKDLSSGQKKVAVKGDWYSDQTAKIKGTKYYRIATDQWVKAKDAVLYRPEFNIVTMAKGTLIYDEEGTVVRTATKDEQLQSDRISEINGIRMYRIATNEWIII